MDDHSLGIEQVAIRIESTDLKVAPGSSANVPLLLHNQSLADGFFDLTVSGIPSTWVSVPMPVVRLAAGEQREVLMSIQPPSLPTGRAGRHQLLIRVASQETPQQAAEATCTLTVAAFAAPGRIGLLLAATEFSVVPEENVAISLVLFNQGLEGDSISLSVEDIPSGWVSASSASTPLSPGQQQEVTLTIRPALSDEGGAGRHPFKILASSQAAPGQVTVAECALIIADFSRFRIDLTPQRSEAGAPARVTVENQGNIDQIFTLAWQNPDDGLDFEPAATQQLRIAPGDAAIAQFSARPRSRPLFGQERIFPFTTHVQANGGGTRNLSGEIVGKALIPSWLVVVVLVAILACVGFSVLGASLGGCLDQAPPPAPEATAPADQDQPAEPPAEQPVEPPPDEQPVEPPPEQPVEPPPEEPAPGEGEGRLPFTPVVAGPALALLLQV